jgi:hypothetical protein
LLQIAIHQPCFFFFLVSAAAAEAIAGRRRICPQPPSSRRQLVAPECTTWDEMDRDELKPSFDIHPPYIKLLAKAQPPDRSGCIPTWHNDGPISNT